MFNAIYNDFGGGFIEAYGDSSYIMAEPVYFLMIQLFMIILFHPVGLKRNTKLN